MNALLILAVIVIAVLMSSLFLAMGLNSLGVALIEIEGYYSSVYSLNHNKLVGKLTYCGYVWTQLGLTVTLTTASLLVITIAATGIISTIIV